MPTIPSQLDLLFRRAIAAALGFDAEPVLAPSQNPAFGDYQANCAMALAKEVGARTGQKTNPRAVAQQILAKLELGEIGSADIAGPGFINVKLSPAWLATQLQHAAADPRLGIQPVAPRQRVVIDYSSPNVAKQMHVGHLRPTNIGDAISRIIEFLGHDVVRQNHLGDWGTQFGMLLRYLEEQPAGADQHIADLEEFYRSAKKRFDEDASFAEEARQFVVRLQGGDEHMLALWRRIIDESRRHFEAIYAEMDIKLTRENERGESFYNPMLADVVRELREKNVAEFSEGAVVVWVKPFEAPLIIQKSGGGFGYGTTDLAALRYRIRDLQAQRVIYVTDARQGQHFRMFFDAAQRAGWTQGTELDHVMFGMILGDDGTPLKTRSGETVKLASLLAEAQDRALALVRQKLADRQIEIPEAQQRDIAGAVGIGAIKYFDLNRDPVGNYVFDWNKMLSLDGNTAPYLQYAYARIRSIFRKAGSAASQGAGAAITLDHPAELALAKHLLRFAEIAEVVGRELKPHHLCNYLYDLATRFSTFYENCPVLQSEERIRGSRLALCDLAARTLALGLELLGIRHPEQM